jgi:hypothetical protein
MRACVEALLVTGALLLAGCQTPARTGSGLGPSVVVTQDEEPEWRGVANREDAQRIAELSGAWREALTGVGRQARGEGRLLDPEAALPKPAPSPGSYMCRVIRLGSAKPREPAYQAFKPFFCHVGVNGEQLSITKQTGTERPAGYLWEDADTKRMIFLGFPGARRRRCAAFLWREPGARYGRGVRTHRAASLSARRAAPAGNRQAGRHRTGSCARTAGRVITRSVG